jgi:hypothetical protein
MMSEHDRILFDEYASLIRSWHGAHGQLSQYSITSHSGIRVELKRPESSQALLILCYLPTYIAGPVRWPNAHLDLWEVPTASWNHPAVPEQVLFDPIAGVTIRCHKVNAVLIPIEESTRGT